MTLFHTKKKSIVLGNQEKIYHGTLYFKGKNLIKEDRILDDSARYCFEIQWILNTILKNPFYAILGYSKLMDHNDLVSLNNKRSSCARE
jgi:hypothetical protein